MELVTGHSKRTFKEIGGDSGHLNRRRVSGSGHLDKMWTSRFIDTTGRTWTYTRIVDV